MKPDTTQLRKLAREVIGVLLVRAALALLAYLAAAVLQGTAVTRM